MCVCFCSSSLATGGGVDKKKVLGREGGEEEISSTLRKKGEGRGKFFSVPSPTPQRGERHPSLPTSPPPFSHPALPPCPQGTESSVSGRACSVTENKNLSYFPPYLSFLFFMRRDGVGKKV